MARSVMYWRISPRDRSKSAFSRAILLRKKTTGILKSSENSHAFSVWTSTPCTPLTTMTAASATRMELRMSPMKSA